MKNNLLIGAISGNYSILDVQNWIRSSDKFEDVHRVLLLYNNTNPELHMLYDHGVDLIVPNFDFHGNNKDLFETNTQKNNTNTSYELIHNIRFLHIWMYLNQYEFKKVLCTDVKDVYFNSNPFEDIPIDKLKVTSECIKYKDHAWNAEHIRSNLGLFALDLFDKYVYNVGVLCGGYEIVKNISRDICLMSVGKEKVADQTTFNYLINSTYKNDVILSDLSDKFAVHLHVINEGLVNFDLSSINEYKIIHQYDRISGFKPNII